MTETAYFLMERRSDMSALARAFGSFVLAPMLIKPEPSRMVISLYGPQHCGKSKIVRKSLREAAQALSASGQESDKLAATEELNYQHTDFGGTNYPDVFHKESVEEHLASNYGDVLSTCIEDDPVSLYYFEHPSLPLLRQSDIAISIGPGKNLGCGSYYYEIIRRCFHELTQPDNEENRTSANHAIRTGVLPQMDVIRSFAQNRIKSMGVPVSELDAINPRDLHPHTFFGFTLINDSDEMRAAFLNFREKCAAYMYRPRMRALKACAIEHSPNAAR